jgi:hypothetical protein
MVASTEHSRAVLSAGATVDVKADRWAAKLVVRMAALTAVSSVVRSAGRMAADLVARKVELMAGALEKR